MTSGFAGELRRPWIAVGRLHCSAAGSKVDHVSYISPTLMLAEQRNVLMFATPCSGRCAGFGSYRAMFCQKKEQLHY
ncbi:hypothetical protein X766_34525 [Mesorhizobium sp. LSJC255A00]|nr:hypothetical protein X766_34525 [Mesorhizobium sp. LSJC255A00]ESZ67371.1 hypothetical protein X726_32950 [Mesorhizobium sp. L103C105A0]